MDAIVAAGGVPQPGEPLYEYTQGGYKALLDVAGKPMIQWVLNALDEAATVDQIVVIGLPEGTGVTCSKCIAYMPDQGEMLDNIRAGVKKMLALNPGTQHVLSVSSDIPAVTVEAINWVVQAALETDHDLYYNLITRQVMEARFPSSRRSYTRIKGMEVCGGDVNVIRAITVAYNEELWQRIIAARKNVFKQAALIGYDVLLLLLLRAITLDNGVKIASKRLGIKGRAILCPYAEVGMDIDKPHQLEILRADLTYRIPV